MARILLRTFRYLGYFILGFAVFVGLYLLSAYSLSRIAVGGAPKRDGDVAVFIKTNGVHTDIVVPIRNDQMDWVREIKFANTHLTDTSKVRYLAMGWGDKGFYLNTPTWADLTFKTAFKAVFGLGRTAIHATFYDSLTQNETCRRIMISAGEYQRLISYITGSFQHDSAGHVLPIATTANYSNADAFYEANGSYSLFHTCNTWANTGLKKAGQRACLWTPFDTGIFLKYK